MQIYNQVYLMVLNFVVFANLVTVAISDHASCENCQLLVKWFLKNRKNLFKYDF